MKQIRSSIFETNSSMTHSLVICENHEYSKWLENVDKEFSNNDSKNNYYLFNLSNGKFLPYKEAIKENVKKLLYDLGEGELDENVGAKDIEEYKKGNKYLTDITNDLYDLYITADEFSSYYYEYEVDSFKHTLKSGEEIEGFCYYGRD